MRDTDQDKKKMFKRVLYFDMIMTICCASDIGTLNFESEHYKISLYIITTVDYFSIKWELLYSFTYTSVLLNTCMTDAH